MITHLLLIQSIIPVAHFYFNYNESSWYVLTLIFCYLFTEILIRLIEKIQNKYTEVFRAILIILVTVVIQVVLSKIFNDTQLAQWILYISPFNRILDYFMGMVVGFIYVNKKENIKLGKNIITIFEILIFFIVVVDYIHPINIYYKVNIRPLILLGIFIFSLENGLISKFLSNKVFMYFANFSFEFFMIYMPIIIIYGKISEILGLNTSLVRGVTVIASFIITVVLSKVLNTFATKSKYKIPKELSTI